jgi:hypothetical protein
MSFVGRSQQSFAGFDPRTFGGLALWLDAADQSTLTLSGSNVTAWREKSLSATPLTLSTGSGGSTIRTTYNGLPVVQLSNSCFVDASYSYPLATRSIFFVLAETAHSDWRGLLTFANGALPDFADRSTYAITSTNTVGSNVQFAQNIESGGFVYNYNASNGVKDVPFQLYEDVTSNTAVTLFIAGSNVYSSNTSVAPLTSTGFTLGGRDAGPSPGAIVVAEVLLYSNALTTTQRQQVEGYLARKWGLLSNLPATHLYKRIPLTLRPLSPPDIGGVTLWLDGADSNSMTLSGNNITQWRDKSGFGRHVSNSGTGAVYSSSGPVFGGSEAFQGSANYLHDAATGTWSFFTVFTPTNIGANNPRILNYIGQWFYIEGQRFTMFNPQIFGSSPIPYQRCLASIVNDTSAITLYINGRADVSAGPALNTNSGSTFTVGGFDGGGGDRFYGTIHEMITFSNGLTTSQRQQVENYLSRKWGISGILTNHPYRYIAPSFTPTQLPGCVLWLDATDSSYVQRTGSTLTGWADKSPNARTVTLTGAIGWSNNAVTTASSRDSYLSVNLNVQKSVAPSLSVFLVYKWLGYGSNVDQVLWGNDVPNSVSRVQMLTFPIFSSSTFTYVGGVKLWQLNTPDTLIYALTATVNSASSIALNGVPTPFTESGPQITSHPGWETIRFGTGHLNASMFNAYVSFSEILIYTSNLSTTDRQLVEGYLGWKWGLQSRLGVTHPAPFYRALSVPFTPLQIPGCTLWLDGQDATTLTFSGSNVTRWADKSGLGNDASQGTVASAPTYVNDSGFPSLRFSRASGQFLRGPGVFTSIRYGAFLVYRGLGADGQTPFFDLKKSGGPEGSVYVGNYMIAGLRTSRMAYAEIPATFKDAAYVTFTTDRTLWGHVDSPENPSSNFYHNGSLLGQTFYNGGASNIATDQNGYWLSRGGDYDGFICEVLVFTVEPTAVQRQQIEGYLAARWGLQTFLSSNHPYKYSKP